MVNPYTPKELIKSIKERNLYVQVVAAVTTKNGTTENAFVCLEMKSIKYDETDLPDRPFKVTLVKYKDESRERVVQRSLLELWNCMGAKQGDHYLLNDRAKQGNHVALVTSEAPKKSQSLQKVGPPIPLRFKGKDRFVYMYGNDSSLSGIVWPSEEGLQSLFRKECGDRFSTIQKKWQVWKGENLDTEKIMSWNKVQTVKSSSGPQHVVGMYGSAWDSMQFLRLKEEDELIYGTTEDEVKKQADVQETMKRRLEYIQGRWKDWQVYHAPKPTDLYKELRVREHFMNEDVKHKDDAHDRRFVEEDEACADFKNVRSEVELGLSTLIIRAYEIESVRSDKLIPDNERVKDRQVIGWSTRQSRWLDRATTYNDTLKAHVNNKEKVRKSFDEAQTREENEPVTTLFKSRIYQKEEMRTLSSFVGSRVHQILAWNSTENGAWNMCFPAKDEEEDYKQFNNYMTTRGDQIQGLGFLDNAIHNYVKAVEKKMNDMKWETVGVEIPVVDSLRLFLRDSRYQWMESRVDVLCVDEKGKIVLVDYKNKIGFKTQKDHAKPDDWHQVFTYAMLMALNYGIVVDSVAVIIAKRGSAVEVERCEFFPKARMRERGQREAKSKYKVQATEVAVRRYMEALWWPFMDDNYWYVDDHFVANAVGIAELKERKLYKHLYLNRLMDAIGQRKTKVEREPLKVKWTKLDGPHNNKWYQINGMGLYTTVGQKSEGRPPEYLRAFKTYGKDELRIDQIGWKRRVGSEPVYKTGSDRDQLNKTVWESAGKLVPMVSAWTPVGLSDELRQVAGRELDVRPNGPILEEGVNHPMQTFLCRTLNRLINKQLFDDLLQIESESNAEERLSDVGMALFEHVSQRALWSDEQLKYARTKYLPEKMDRLKIALLDCITAYDPQ